MIHARDFVDAARARGYSWYAGVPCSFLTPFINFVISDPELNYVSSANEGDAVAVAAGSWIGGKRGVAMMQNSGLGNAVSPLTSLTYTFRIPVLLVCTHRGAPGVNDEPQHELMGKVTSELFQTMTIPWAQFPRQTTDIEDTLDDADRAMRDAGRPYALIMQKGTCEPFELQSTPTHHLAKAGSIDGDGHARDPSQRATRRAVLERLVNLADVSNSVIIATTGYTGRELYAVADRANHLYMVGSMGCAPSLGLGLALARPDLEVIVVDGDGAALMRMGNLATVGSYAPRNFRHLLLDNEAHDSTGAQMTVSGHIDFAAVAAACGYAAVMRSDDPEALANFIAAEAPGASFMHLKIKTGTIEDLPRPQIAPPQVLARLMSHIGSHQ